MRYVETLMGGKIPSSNFTNEQEGLLSYAGLCIRDFLRDFNPNNYTTETDFNLKNYLIAHDLDPVVLISYIHTIQKELEHYSGDEVYSKKKIRGDMKACKKIIRELEKYSV